MTTQEKLAAELNERATAVLVAAATGNESILLAEVNKLIACARSTSATLLSEHGGGGEAAAGELLPCPFCGAHASRWDYDASRGDVFGVCCSNDDCPADVYAEGDSREAADAAWNRRTTPPTTSDADTRARACGFDNLSDALAHLEAAAGKAPTPSAQHPDDAAVDRFAAAMKAKLAKKRAEGRGGWDDPEQCKVESLSELLHGHVRKGDPVDVGNLAMMLHQRGSGILPAPPSAPAQYAQHPSGDGTIVRKVEPLRRLSVDEILAAMHGQSAPVVDDAMVVRILDWQPLTHANRGTRLWQILEDAGLPHDKQIAALTAALSGVSAPVGVEWVRKQLPDKVKSIALDDLNEKELGIFDNGYNAALTRVHDLLNMASSALDNGGCSTARGSAFGGPQEAALTPPAAPVGMEEQP